MIKENQIKKTRGHNFFFQVTKLFFVSFFPFYCLILHSSSLSLSFFPRISVRARAAFQVPGMLPDITIQWEDLQYQKYSKVPPVLPSFKDINTKSTLVEQ